MVTAWCNSRGRLDWKAHPHTRPSHSPRSRWRNVRRSSCHYRLVHDSEPMRRQQHALEVMSTHDLVEAGVVLPEYSTWKFTGAGLKALLPRLLLSQPRLSFCPPPGDDKMNGWSNMQLIADLHLKGFGHAPIDPRANDSRSLVAYSGPSSPKL